MIRSHKTRKAIILLAAVLLAASAASAALLFDKSEYAARRAKLMEKIPDGVAFILGAQPLTSYYDYHQNNDFFYLCGVEAPNAVLLIDGIRKGEVTEAFGAGTAAVVTPIGAIGWKGRDHILGEGRTGEWTQHFYTTLTNMQYGRAADPFGWIRTID